jgi:uncharacterized protein YecE (DUF72 family)
MKTGTFDSPPPAACRLMVGTSGYSYTEWIQAGFYPPGTRSDQMLPLYAESFSITELNYTWYQMPKPPSVERMREKVPPNFRFSAKLTRTMTHEVDPDQWRSEVSRYRDGLAPLTQSGQLAAVLVQLPPHFDRAPQNRRYLAALLDQLAGLPVAVEFRHASWARDRVFDELQQRRVTLVAVDAPPLPELFPRLDVVTNPDLFYLRFHGRNTKGWRSGNLQNQFDYDYSDAQLEEWTGGPVGKMAAQARSGIVFFNNHVRAQAPKNAYQFIRQLIEKGILKGTPRPPGRAQQG